MFSPKTIIQTIMLLAAITLNLHAADSVPVSLSPMTVSSSYIPIVHSIGKSSNGCTVTHIGGGVAITAGHCFKAKKFIEKGKACSSVTVIWGYYSGSTRNIVSRCTTILAMQRSINVDYAILLFDTYPHDTVDVEVDDMVLWGAGISMFGHPWGKPMVWSRDCTVQSSKYSRHAGPKQFTHRCPAEPGYSGAPIIDNETKKVIGIHNGGANGWSYGTFLYSTPIRGYL